MESKNQIRGIISLLLAGLVFVFNDSLMKMAMVNLPPYEVLVLRGAAGAVFAFALLAVRGQARWHKALYSWPVLMRAGLECVAILTYIIALKYAPIGDVTALFQTTPLLVFVGLIFLQGEKASLLRLGLVLVGFAGAMMVAQPGWGTISPYAMLAIISAAFAAARDLAARKIAGDLPALLSTFVLILVVLSASLICNLLFEHWVTPSFGVLTLPVVAGLMMMLGHHFTLLAYRLADGQVVAPFYYSFMVFAVIFGYLIFGDVPNLLGFVGMLIIVLSGLAILWFGKQEQANVFQSPDL